MSGNRARAANNHRPLKTPEPHSASTAWGKNKIVTNQKAFLKTNSNEFVHLDNSKFIIDSRSIILQGDVKTLKNKGVLMILRVWEPRAGGIGSPALENARTP